MAIQGVAIVALTVGLASLLYYIFANNGAQEEPYGYGNTRGANGSTFERFPNYFTSLEQSSNNEQQNRHRKRSKRLQNENTVCTICLQEISSQRKVLPCNHSFHEKCINTWRSEGPMGSRNTCPICRQIHVNI
ncbi:PREDICTED: RING finger protein 44-like isoform X1 [Polistes dominula]|uniref:RING finger protein 44-like isoform X1 n=1 Tax=Polistes dominula TaxID=743375 RepID=A0ABM1I5X6_POLDO|nr:PREDICTED: RING finger protein 44-like isoform X1 [Polistes dominula]